MRSIVWKRPRSASKRPPTIATSFRSFYWPALFCSDPRFFFPRPYGDVFPDLFPAGLVLRLGDRADHRRTLLLVAAPQFCDSLQGGCAAASSAACGRGQHRAPDSEVDLDPGRIQPDRGGSGEAPDGIYSA